MAARGPSGGGHLPRVLKSGGDILEAKAKGFEDVVLFDLRRAVEVRRGASDSPGPMEAAGRDASMGAPALERASCLGRQAGELAESGRLQLGVEAALTFLLQAPGGDHPLPHR